ncbi:hypothetical protein BJF88_03685 [Cellulosimicrobium sp. CUA-896]|nr:hypothetical protein BJF88_03685 [Cellulosimicrobium sp. CUA-896]
MLDAATSAWPMAIASSRRTFSSKRESSLVGSSTLMELSAPCTVCWACALFCRATRESRRDRSSPSLPFIAARPDLSFSTVSRWDAMSGSAWRTSCSALIWRPSATLARASNLSALSASPACR